MKFARAFMTISLLTALSRAFGFGRDMLLAAVLGAGPLADAFFVALKLPNLFRRLTAEGAFSAAFIPIYSASVAKDGTETARDFAARAAGLLLVILLPVLGLALCFTPALVTVLAPGMVDEPERFLPAVTMARLTLPYLVPVSLVALYGGVLNAHGHYAPLAAAPIWFNLTLMAALIAISISVTLVASDLPMAVPIAGLVQMAMIVWAAQRHGLIFWPKWPRRDARLRKLFTLLIPGICGAGVVQVSQMIDVMLASLLPAGSVSHLYYADRIYQLPLGIVGVAIGTALLPLLSSALAAGKQQEANMLYNRALEVSLLLALPACAALLVVAEPLVTILYQRGKFLGTDAASVARTVHFYAFGIPAYLMVKVPIAVFFARQNGRAPLILTLVGTLFDVILTLILIRPFGVAGVAMATACAAWLQLGLSFWLGKPSQRLGFDARLRRRVPLQFLASVILGLALYGLRQVLPVTLPGMAMLVISGMGIYAVSVLVLGAARLDDVALFAKKSVKLEDISP